MKRPSLRRSFVAKLDAAFSLAVRLMSKRDRGPYCPFPHGTGAARLVECCFHFVTRAKYSTRWDFSNAVGACHGCNYQNEYDPHPFIRWYIGEHGVEAYNDLVAKSHQIAKFSNDQLKEKLEEIRKSLEGLAALC